MPRTLALGSPRWRDTSRPRIFAVLPLSGIPTLGPDAHAGSRTRVTSMGGLYDAATLHALLCSYCLQTRLCMTSFGCMGNSSRLGRTRHCCSSPRAAGLDRQATWHGAMGSCAADARTLSRGRAHVGAAVRRAPGDMLLLARDVDRQFTQQSPLQHEASVAAGSAACLPHWQPRCRQRGDSSPCGQSPMDF